MNLANKRGKTSQWSSSNNFRQSYGRNFIELPGTLVGKMLGTRWTRRSPLPVCICQKYTLIFIARRDYRAFGIVMAGTLNYKNVFRHQIPVVHPGVCIENLWKIQTGKYCPSSVGGGVKSFSRIKPRKCLNNVNRFNFCHCGKVFRRRGSWGR